MSHPRPCEIDAGELLENQRLGRFHALTFALCFLILFIDGLDYSTVNVAAGELVAAPATFVTTTAYAAASELVTLLRLNADVIAPDTLPASLNGEPFFCH